MKVYIAGKVTGLPIDEVKCNFKRVESDLKQKGYTVMSPAALFDNTDFEYEDYMHVCYAMIDVCDAIYLQKNWQSSKGSRMEMQYAKEWHKTILFEDEDTKEL